jgi:hypothetical protein
MGEKQKAHEELELLLEALSWIAKKREKCNGCVKHNHNELSRADGGDVKG